jgi:hypothetical protein
MERLCSADSVMVRTVGRLRAGLRELSILDSLYLSDYSGGCVFVPLNILKRAGERVDASQSILQRGAGDRCLYR